MAQRRYYAQQYFVDNNEPCRRMGEAYKIPRNWERVLTLSLCRWFKAIAESRNTPREYVFLNLLPTIDTMMGTRVSAKVFQEHLEKLNLFVLILGEPSAGNYYFMFIIRMNLLYI